MRSGLYRRLQQPSKSKRKQSICIIPAERGAEHMEIGIQRLIKEGFHIDWIEAVNGNAIIMASKDLPDPGSFAYGLDWQPNHKTSRFFDIKNCARCSADHNHLEFFHFTRKTTIDFVEYHYWTLCPILREPILMSIQSDTDASPEVQS